MPLQHARVFVQRQTKPFQMLVFSPVATRSVTSSFQSSCSSIQITTLTLLKQYLQVCEDVYKVAKDAQDKDKDKDKDAKKENGVEGVAVTSSTLLISLAVGLLMK